MANSYDYFKQQVAQMENIRAKTAHEQHILEFRAMCAKMINDAIPDIKQQCMEECRREIDRYAEKNACKCRSENKQDKVDVRLDFKNIEQQIRNAFRKVFK